MSIRRSETFVDDLPDDCLRVHLQNCLAKWKLRPWMCVCGHQT